MDEALENDQIRTIPEEEAGVVILNGEPYMNIDGRYVLKAEADVIFQERKVRRETEKLREMEQALFKKAAELKGEETVPPISTEEAEKLVEGLKK